MTYKLHTSGQKVAVPNYCHTGSFNRGKPKRLTVNCPCIIILSQATSQGVWEGKQYIASLTTADFDVYTALSHMLSLFDVHTARQWWHPVQVNDICYTGSRAVWHHAVKHDCVLQDPLSNISHMLSLFDQVRSKQTSPVVSLSTSVF